MLDVVLDRNEWRSFCKYLGKDPKSVRLRSFFPKGHHLKERDHGKKYHADSGWIQKCQNEGRGVYIVINDGGDTDKEITNWIKDAEASLVRANITCNKNGIPFDTQSPMVTSGIRLGTPACTTRGFGPNEFSLIGDLISKVLNGLSKNGQNNSKIEKEVQKEVIDLCSSFPIYSD